MADSDWPNPPVLTSKPTDGQTLVYQASTNTWIPATISSSGITVPQTHEGAVSVTSAQNSTSAAVDLTTSEALANALKTSYNAAQVDIAAVIAALNTLLTELHTAGILS
jgi:hypothetical protein